MKSASAISRWRRRLPVAAVAAAVIALASIAVKLALESFLERRLIVALNRLGPDVSARVDRVRLDLLHRCLAVHGVALSDTWGAVAGATRVEVRAFRPGAFLPRRLHARGVGLWVDAGVLDPDWAAAVRHAGVEGLSGDAGIDLRYDNDSRTLDLDMTVAVAELGALSGRARLLNVHLPGGDCTALTMALWLALLADAVVEYRGDGGDGGRLLSLLARLQETDPETFRHDVAFLIRRRQFEPSDAALSQSLAALAHFMANPQRLRLELRPSRPFSYLDLKLARTVERLVRLTGLELRAAGRRDRGVDAACTNEGKQQ